MTTIISLLIALVTVLGNAVAWFVKLKWSKEFVSAKNAEITALKQVIENLKSLSPPIIYEWVESTKKIMGQYNDDLKMELEKTKTELERNIGLICKLEGNEQKQAEQLEVINNKIKSIEEYRKKTDMMMQVLSLSLLGECQMGPPSIEFIESCKEFNKNHNNAGVIPIGSYKENPYDLLLNKVAEFKREKNIT